MENTFKAKRIDNNEWVEGYFFKHWDKCYIAWGTINDKPMMTEVIPETVGQLTVLKDKHGEKIYTKDKVKCHYFYEALGEGLGVYEAEKEIIGQIVFEDLGLWIKCESEEDSSYLLWINGLHEESFEIIK